MKTSSTVHECRQSSVQTCSFANILHTDMQGLLAHGQKDMEGNLVGNADILEEKLPCLNPMQTHFNNNDSLNELREKNDVHKQLVDSDAHFSTLDAVEKFQRNSFFQATTWSLLGPSDHQVFMCELQAEFKFTPATLEPCILSHKARTFPFLLFLCFCMMSWGRRRLSHKKRCGQTHNLSRNTFHVQPM